MRNEKDEFRYSDIASPGSVRTAVKASIVSALSPSLSATSNLLSAASLSALECHCRDIDTHTHTHIYIYIYISTHTHTHENTCKHSLN